MRKDWAAGWARLLAPGAELATIIFPVGPGEPLGVTCGSSHLQTSSFRLVAITSQCGAVGLLPGPGCWLLQGAERATSIVAIGPGWDMRSTEGLSLRRFWFLCDQPAWRCWVAGMRQAAGTRCTTSD
jgi:hypothetical protein